MQGDTLTENIFLELIVQLKPGFERTICSSRHFINNVFQATTAVTENDENIDRTADSNF